MDLNFLKELTEVDGISGYESEVRKLVERKFREFLPEENISYDNLGSIIGKTGTEGPKIMLSGHLDEIGMIVTKITDQGFIKFQTIGGWWSQVMLAQQVTITTSEGKKYLGVIGSKPPHILEEEEKKKPFKIDDMFIDLGVRSKEEVVNLGIKVGDMIAPNVKFQVMANEDTLLAKAWDNRIGCAIMLAVLEKLQHENHPNIVYGVGTVQEEVGLRGAKTASNIIKPDISIAVDVGIAKDTPGTDGSTKLGSGPLFLLYDGGLIGHVGLRKLFVETAEEHQIPYQFDYLKRGATDAGAMHLAHAGSPAISLCIPSRYIHSHSSLISKSDFENCVKLVVEVIKKLNRGTVDKITYN